MLSWQVHPGDDGPHPMQNHLVECVTSATAIIAIFDLFCRTFTINHCVLSLSYSVYIAATIFLLQVQATPEDQQAVRKLNFCIHALHQIKFVNPGKWNRVRAVFNSNHLQSSQVPLLSLQER